MTNPRRVQLERFRRAVDALPRLPGDVYRLHAVEGLDYTATAERLGLKPGQVERLLAEAIVQIDQNLRRQESGG